MSMSTCTDLAQFNSMQAAICSLCLLKMMKKRGVGVSGVDCDESDMGRGLWQKGPGERDVERGLW